MLRRRMVPAVFASVVVLAGCGDDSDPIASPSQEGPVPTSSAAVTGDPIPVLASTDVYGDIARQIGGDRVEVTSIIAGEAQDPHSYEATVRDELAVSRARVVITNGGHYDEFMTRLLSAAGGDRKVLTAVDIAEGHEDEGSPSTSEPTSSASSSEASASPSAAEDEHAEDEHAEGEHAEDEHAEDEEHSEAEHAHEAGENEHVWYDLAAMKAVAEELSASLSELEPDSRAEFEENLATFSRAIDALQQKQAEIRAEHDGVDVAVTEIVAGWLLEDAGLDNRTPAAFSEAIEEGTDVPVRVLQETLALMEDDTVRVLIYNEQTTGPQTDQMRKAAEDADVPIVTVRETLPEGSGYLEWMDNTLNALRDALA